MPTSNFTLTRDELIELAYKKIGVLAEGETLSSELEATAIKQLNLIVRKIDAAGKWLWAINSTPSTITLVANTFVYTSANGLPTDILELVTVSFRDATANDSPITILTTEGYEAITDKIQVGDPLFAYLAEHKTISSRTLFVTPMLSSVNTQSVVTGTDAAAWKCIRSHVADSTNRPITGANYLLYWESGGSGPATWVTGTSYVAPQLLRLWYKRPLYDFDAASDNPDFPQQWCDHLVWKLAEHLSPNHNRPIEERRYLGQMAQQAYEEVYPSVTPLTNDTSNAVQYY